MSASTQSGAERAPSIGGDLFTSTAKLWIAAALLSAVYFGMQGGPERAADLPEGQLFAAADPGAVVRIELKRGNATVTLARQDGETFTVEEAHGYPADRAKVTRLLEAMRDLEAVRLASRNAAPEKLAAFQLEEARHVQVVLQDKSGAQLASLRVGKTGSDRETFFLRQAGDDAPVLLGKPDQAELRSTRPTAWIDTSLLGGAEAASIVRVTARTMGTAEDGTPETEVVSLRRDGEEEDGAALGEGWVLTEPYEYPAKTEPVAQLLRKIAGLAADDVVARDTAPSKSGLDAPARTIEVELADGRVLELAIGKSERRRTHLRTSARPGVFLVADHRLRGLADDAAALRETDILAFADDAVREVGLARAEGPRIELRRAGRDGEWEVTAPDRGDADAAAVRGLLQALRALRYDEQVWDGRVSALAMTPPAWSVQLVLDDAAEGEPSKPRAIGIEVFPPGAGAAADGPFSGASAEEEGDAEGDAEAGADVGEPEDEARLVRRTDDGAVFRVPTAALEKTRLELHELRGGIIEFGRYEVAAVIRHGDPKSLMVMQKTDRGQWVMQQPMRFAVERKAADGLLDALVGLKPAALAPRSAFQALGFNGSQPWFEVRLQSGEARYVFRAPEKDGLVPITTEAVRTIGLCRPEDLEALEASIYTLRDRRVWGGIIAEDMLLEVDLGAPAAPDRTRLARDAAGVWRITSPGGGLADANAVRRLAATLGRLQGERVVEVDAALQEKVLPAEWEIRILLKNRASLSLFFGQLVEGEEPPLRYAAMPQQGVAWLVRESTFEQLLKGAPDLRDQRLFAYEDADVTRVDLQPREGDLHRASREGEGPWRIEARGEAGAFRGDPTRLRQVLSGLRALRTEPLPEPEGEEAAPTLADAGLEPPLLTIAVYTGGEEPVGRIEIGGEVEGRRGFRYLRRPGAEPELGRTSMLAVFEPDLDLRDRRLLPVTPDAVDRLTWVRAGEPGPARVEITRGEGGLWSFAAPEDLLAAKVDAEVVQTVLRQLERVEVAPEADLDPAAATHTVALAPAWLTLEVGHDGGEVTRVAIGDLTAGRRFRYAQTDDRPGLLGVPLHRVTAVAPELERLEDRTVLALTAREVRAYTVRPADAEPFRAVHDAQSRGWSAFPLAGEGAEGADAIAADRAIAESVLRPLRKLRWSRRPTADELADTGLDAPRVVVEIERADGGPSTIAVGKALRSETFIGVDGGDPQLVASGAIGPVVGQRSARGLVERVLVATRVEALRRVTITEGETTHALVPGEGGTWLVEGTDRAVPKTDATVALNPLRGLRATNPAPSDDLAESGLDAPAAIIVLESDAETVRLEIGTDDGRLVRVKRADRPTVMLVPKPRLDALRSLSTKAKAPEPAPEPEPAEPEPTEPEPGDRP